MSALEKRILSAVAIILLIGSVFYLFGTQGLFFLGFLLASLCAFEFAGINFSLNGAPKSISLLFLALNLLVLFISARLPNTPMYFLAGSCCIFVTCSLWMLRGACDNDTLYRVINRGLLGFLYVGVFPALALRLMVVTNGLPWFWFLVAIVVVGDIAAYFVGSSLGKHKLMPDVSPNKSWEGAAGALIGALAVSVLFKFWLLSEVPSALVIATGLTASITAQTGDLFESLMKRVANVKDSGRLLPGHGGFLDRLDGILFGAPVVYIAYVYYFETLLA
jgi:phosphatidate cytidylyltransferase